MVYCQKWKTYYCCSRKYEVYSYRKNKLCWPTQENLWQTK